MAASSPGGRPREIGLKPIGNRLCEVADGSAIALEISVTQIVFLGDESATSKPVRCA